MQEKKKKMVVFGIDGGTFDIMRPLLKNGELPNLASILKDGVEAELPSVIPYVTPTAFISFMTGVNPGKHSVLDFRANAHSTYDSGPIVNFSDVRGKTLWDLLSGHDKRMNVMGVPFTYPPAPLNGAMLCLGNISEGRISTYPPEMTDELIENIGGYEERYCKVMREPNGAISEDLLDEYIGICKYQSEKVTQSSLYLLQSYPWDVLMIVFVITDRFQHYFWKNMDDTHPAHEPDHRPGRSDLILDSYRIADQAIGRIMKEVPEDAHIMVMSDHGFGPLHYHFYTNIWLERQGLLHYRKERTRWTRTEPTVCKLLNKAGLRQIAGALPESIGNVKLPFFVKRPLPVEESIDWTKTKAYATRWGININVSSREPSGIVKPGEEYEALLSGIMKNLSDVRHPINGLPLFQEIIRKEDAYHGPYMQEASDILLASEGIVLSKGASTDILRQVNASDFGNGDHKKNGILILKGPSIEPGAKPDSPKLEDLAPTILYLMDLPVPQYMDGKVLTSCIRADVLKDKPVIRDASVSFESDRSSEVRTEKGGDDDNEERVKEQLRNLGYIE